MSNRLFGWLHPHANNARCVLDGIDDAVNVVAFDGNPQDTINVCARGDSFVHADEQLGQSRCQGMYFHRNDCLLLHGSLPPGERSGQGPARSYPIIRLIGEIPQACF